MNQFLPFGVFRENGLSSLHSGQWDLDFEFRGGDFARGRVLSVEPAVPLVGREADVDLTILCGASLQHETLPVLNLDAGLAFGRGVEGDGVEQDRFFEFFSELGITAPKVRLRTDCSMSA